MSWGGRRPGAGGKPRKPGAERTTFQFKCTKGERLAYEEAARGVGKTTSEWARDILNKAALGG